MGHRTILNSKFPQSYLQKIRPPEADCKTVKGKSIIYNNSQIYAGITEKIIANLETAGSWMKLWHFINELMPTFFFKSSQQTGEVQGTHCNNADRW